MNVDAAVNENNDSIGIGGTIRNQKGAILTCWALKRPGHFDVLSSELLAIREGIRLAIDSGYPIDEIESDSLLVIRAISRVQHCFAIASIIKDINLLTSSAGYGSCRYIFRVRNIAAHKLEIFVIGTDRVKI
ncbi:Ribonuclease H-like domain containing protein [Parasponia andersonii]|uniref:Ribonuclease H-like domain containing protein n=1 Tax=Parasponia andersonii TaxID=3476 RepID=A0A2P5DYP6_PARAD|nr:Ribonuclease H-like domain containing protein [Parasponia andersonii]